jgi:integrase
MKTQTRKENLQILKIYTPTSNKDVYLENSDFKTNYFLHFPILLNNDGSVWKHGTLYLLSKLKNYKQPEKETLKSTANNLKYFIIWCEENNIDYLVEAPRKFKRPTYLYRDYLQKKLVNGELSSETIKARINTVIKFYKYLVKEGIKFKFPLWESNTTLISYENHYGNKTSKKIETTDIGKVISSSNVDKYVNYVEDGAKLKPLTYEEQHIIINSLKNIGNIEMTLAFLLSLTTGARIQTIFTLRLKHFERVPSENEKEVKIKVGLGTDCDTKFDKIHILYVPIWVYNKIKIYIKSPRAEKRRNNAQNIFVDNSLQYIFLTNRGVPYYVSKYDPYLAIYKSPSNGEAVRKFISTTLKDEIKKYGLNFDFSFHDLRATFGMNYLESRIHLVKEGSISLSLLLMEIKEKLAHSSLIVTERYLNFRNINKAKESSNDKYENYLMELLDDR